MSKSTTFSVRLPEELREEVAKIAAKENRSNAYIIKEAVEEYIAERLAYFNAIDEALEEVKNGNLIEGDEFFAFLDDEISRLDKLANKSA